MQLTRCSASNFFSTPNSLQVTVTPVAAVFDADDRTAHTDPATKTRREGVRHQLIATLQPEQLLRFEIGSAKAS